MTLHTPHYDVRGRAFCGPTAMSAVTGLPISEIRDAIRQATGNITTTNGAAWPIMGVSDDHLIKAMVLLGWRVAESWSEPAPTRKYTLDEFARDHGDRGPFIVNVTGHYVAISEGEFCDTFTKLPCNLFAGVLDRKWYGHRKRKGSTWVRRWWRFLLDADWFLCLDPYADASAVPYDDGLDIPASLRRVLATKATAS